MFLHIGGDKTIYMPDIVGIFDISAAENPATCEFLRMANDEGFVRWQKGKTKSFVVANEHVYLSSIAANTLRKRWLLGIKGLGDDIQEYTDSDGRVRGN
jgi:hypothetical protein